MYFKFLDDTLFLIPDSRVNLETLTKNYFKNIARR